MEGTGEEREGAQRGTQVWLRSQEVTGNRVRQGTPFPPQYPKFWVQPSHSSPVLPAERCSRSPHTEKQLIWGWEWVMPGMRLGTGDTTGIQG